MTIPERLGGLCFTACRGCSTPARLFFCPHNPLDLKLRALVYLLYLDESGTPSSANERHFILAGIAVFERQIYHLLNAADEFVTDLGLGDPEEIELHASVIAGGRRGVWRRPMPRAQRLDIIESALRILAQAHRSVKAFGVVIDKHALRQGDTVERAFEEICNRFNLFLSRLHSSDDTPRRGLVVMDKASYEQPLQSLAVRFRREGTRWDALRNLAEVPMFVDSKATRLIQLADLLAWAIWRNYEYQDPRYLDLVLRRFDASRGTIHGLYHHTINPGACPCPACRSRR